MFSQIASLMSYSMQTSLPTTSADSNFQRGAAPMVGAYGLKRMLLDIWGRMGGYKLQLHNQHATEARERRSQQSRNQAMLLCAACWLACGAPGASSPQQLTRGKKEPPVHYACSALVDRSHSIAPQDSQEVRISSGRMCCPMRLHPCRGGAAAQAAPTLMQWQLRR